MGRKDLKILVVEDDPIIRFTLVKMLKHRFDTVENAANGQNALDIIADHNFDVIVTDLQMPVMDGYSMIKKLRDEENPTPIIVCSAYSFEDADQYNCSWLSKPIILNNLLELINTCTN